MQLVPGSSILVLVKVNGDVPGPVVKVSIHITTL